MDPTQSVCSCRCGLVITRRITVLPRDISLVVWCGPNGVSFPTKDIAFDMMLVTMMTFGAERVAYSEAHSAVSARVPSA